MKSIFKYVKITGLIEIRRACNSIVNVVREITIFILTEDVKDIKLNYIKGILCVTFLDFYLGLPHRPCLFLCHVKSVISCNTDRMVNIMYFLPL